MTARDAMEFMNEQDEATLQRFVERLEFRGKDPTFVGYRDSYVDKMAFDRTADLREAARVLRVGGTFAAFDGDYASWTFGYRDHDIARRMEDAIRPPSCRSLV